MSEAIKLFQYNTFGSPDGWALWSRHSLTVGELVEHGD